MKGKIEIYNTATFNIMTDEVAYFVMDGYVFRDNNYTYESQEAVVGFEDCIVKCPHLDWRIV